MMTRERFEVIQREFEQAIKCQSAFGGVESPLLLWGETIRALEGAWRELDAKEGMQILIDELRKGHDRYETVRRLDPAQWADIWKLNISTGKPFDEIIDGLRPFVRPNDPLTGHIAANAAEGE